MGYTTTFSGHVTVSPPLNEHEVRYLKRFAETRRMHRRNGPYYTGTGEFGQDREADVIEYNAPPEGQPGLWCQWVPSDDGSRIAWDGGEKFYHSEEWMRYLIDTFLSPGAALEHELRDRVVGRGYDHAFEHFTFDHVINGVIEAQGEEGDDAWRLVVEDSEVTVDRTARIEPEGNARIGSGL